MLHLSDNQKLVLLIYGSYLIALSIITFFFYFLDKRKAEKNKWRIPEKVLLGLSILGGCFGGYFAMNVFHHKTTNEHWYFTFINLLSLLFHIGTLALLVFVIKF